MRLQWHLWQLSDGNAFKTEFLVNPSKVSKAMASELTKQFGVAEFLHHLQRGADTTL